MERILKRDRLVVLSALITISVVFWIYLLYDARSTFVSGVCHCLGESFANPSAKPWGVVELALIFLMWTEMMIAMMIPTVAPVLLTLAAINRKRRSEQRPFLPTGFFLLGYLAVWTLFSLAATTLQWALQAKALLSPAWATPNALLAGSVLLAAGLFQGTSLKQTCLTHCRSPLDFFLGHWREGLGGAFTMGLRHGTYCLGCCWFLMCLLFVVGVMNIIWIALLTVFVLVEKTVPNPRLCAGLAGIGLVVWGSWVLGHAIK